MYSFVSKYTARSIRQLPTATKSSRTLVTRAKRGQTISATVRAVASASIASKFQKSYYNTKNIVFRGYATQPPVGDDVPFFNPPRIAEDGKRIYTRAEVGQHNTRNDAWIIIDMNVYNITSWIEFHPGGELPLLDKLGKDATVEYEQIRHSHRARAVLDSLLIGHVKEKKRYTIQ